MLRSACGEREIVHVEANLLWPEMAVQFNAESRCCQSRFAITSRDLIPLWKIVPNPDARQDRGTLAAEWCGWGQGCGVALVGDVLPCNVNRHPARQLSSYKQIHHVVSRQQ